MQLRYRQKDNGMYILSKNDIEEIAIDILREYSPKNLEYPMPLDTRDFLEGYLGLTVKQKYIGTLNSGILGLIVMNDFAEIPSYDIMLKPTVLEETYGTVLITPWLMGKENIPRKRYTEIHEGAHFILHKEYYSKNANATANRSSNPFNYIACRRVEINNSKNLSTDVDWMEWQADSLAAALLMPKDVFKNFAKTKIRNWGFQNDYIVLQSDRDKLYAYEVISDMASKFNVSYTSAQIRMRHLGIIRKPEFVH